MIKSFFFVKRERFRKKVRLYRLLLSITFDFVNLFYLSLLLGYFTYGFIRVGEIPLFLQEILNFIARHLNEKENMILILTIFPPIYVIRSFKLPGINYSSSELLLSLLPFRRRYIWFLCYIDKIIKNCLIVTLICIILYLFLPISFSKLVFFSISIWFLTSILLLIQWKLFQLHIAWKIIIIVIFPCLKGLYFLLQHNFILIIYLFVIIGLFIYSVANLFTKVDWQKVVATSDFIIWNMPFVSQATKIKFKKDKQVPLLYRFKVWKEPFPYQIENVYHRLWYIYFEKQIGYLIQITGSLLLLLSVISYFQEINFGIAVGAAIYIQSTFLLTLFKDRLTFDLLSVLPWDIHKLRGTFNNWAILISLFLLIPIGIYSKYYFSNYFILYIVLTIVTFYIFFTVKLNKQLKIWNDLYDISEFAEIVAYILLILVILSVKFQWLLILDYILVTVFYVIRSYKTKQT